MIASGSVLARQGILAAWLVLVWVLLWGMVRIDVVVSGLAVAVLVLATSGLPRLPLRSRLRWKRVPGFALRFARDLVASSWGVVATTLRHGRHTRSAVLRVELPPGVTDAVLMVACHRITLEPGTLVVDVDRERDLLFVYHLDVADEEAAERARRETRLLLEEVHALVTPRRQHPTPRDGGVA